MAETKSVELKPCPFCGSKNVGFDSAQFPPHFVECASCGAFGPNPIGDDTNEEAALVWNIRADDELKAERDALKAQRDELLEAAQCAVDMANALTKCPTCGFTENDRSGKRHGDDCPAGIFAALIAKIEGGAS